MDSYISTKEVCQLLKISRRVIQGYQKEKLINPKSRNKYGYLLFCREEVDRIILIRFFQNIGFSLKEIHGFIDSNFDSIKEHIQNQKKVLQSSLDHYIELISITEQLIEAIDSNKSSEELVSIIKQESSEA